MLDQIDIITNPDGTVEIRDHRPVHHSGVEELSGPALLGAMRTEIEEHITEIAAEATEQPSADNVRRALYAWNWPPEDCDELTLSGVLMQASYVLAAFRQGISTKMAILSMPKPEPCPWRAPSPSKALSYWGRLDAR